MNTATLDARGSAVIHLDGDMYRVSAKSVDDARVQIIQTVFDNVTTFPCQLMIDEADESRTVLEFGKDGDVQEVEVEDDTAPETAPETHEPGGSSAAATNEADDDLPPFLDDAMNDADDDLPATGGTPQTQARGRRVASPRTEVVKRPSAEVESNVTEDPAESQETVKKPSASDFHASKPAPAEGPAEIGWRGVLNMLGFRLSPTNEERAEREDRRDVQRGLTSHKTVMVANLKGGAGKTTFTFLLAAVLGRVRGGTVLAWDNNENRGTLAHRSPIEPNTTATAIDLLHEMQFFEGSGQVAELVNFVRPQGSNKFDLLASQNQGGSRPVIDGEGFTQLHSLLQTFYRMIVVDTGNASNASTWQSTAAVADQIIIVCENAEDSAQTAADTIDTLLAAGHGNTVHNSVAVVMDCRQGRTKEKRAEDKRRLERITQHLKSHVRAVHVLPWEESLDNGAWIDWENLSPTTHRTMLAAAASVVRGM